MMAFLAETYGMAAFAQFLSELRDTRDYRDALIYAYGVSIEQLEEEWRAYLPGFLKEGWRVNVLSAYDLSPGTALYESGRYAEAKDYFARSEKLYRELGKLTMAGEASDRLEKAELAQRADEAVTKAREQLLAHDYGAALKNARQAGATFEELNLTNQQARASEVLTFAERGAAAMSALDRARANLRVFNLPGARQEARTSAEEFAALGDANRLEEANGIIAGLTGWQRLIGLLALGAGAIVVAVVLFVVLRSRRKQYSPARAVIQLKEENPSWL